MSFNDEGNGASDSSLANYKVLRVGDIAFEGHQNKTYPYGRFVLNDVGTGIMSPRFTCLRPKTEQVIEFWKYYINDEYVMNRILVFATKAGTMMNELVIDDFNQQCVHVPAEQEQTAIGRLFTALDSLIAAEQRKIDLLEQKKQAILALVFGHKLRFQTFKSDWQQYELGDITKIIGGGTPDTNTPSYWDGEINWFTPAEIGESTYVSESKRKITELGLNNSSAKLLPAKRTVLFTSRASIGNAAILQVSACTNQGFQSFIASEHLDVYFLYSMCNQIKHEANKKAAGSTFIEISGKQLAKLKVLIPELQEQQMIGELFAEFDTIIDLEKHKTELLELKKKALLQQMFV